MNDKISTKDLAKNAIRNALSDKFVGEKVHFIKSSWRSSNPLFFIREENATHEIVDVEVNFLSEDHYGDDGIEARYETYEIYIVFQTLTRKVLRTHRYSLEDI